jgi:uncharacterized protein
MTAVLDPAALLFGSTRRRVLGWLLGHADEEYYLRELVRHTGGAVGAVQRELEQLTAAGLVRRDARGNQVYFQANRNAAIFPELQGLFAKTTKEAESASNPKVRRRSETRRRKKI